LKNKDARKEELRQILRDEEVTKEGPLEILLALEFKESPQALLILTLM